MITQTCAWFWQNLHPKVGRSHWTNYLRGPVIKQQHRIFTLSFRLQIFSSSSYFDDWSIPDADGRSGPTRFAQHEKLGPLKYKCSKLNSRLVLCLFDEMRIFTSVIVSGSMWRLVLEGPRLTSIWTSPVKKDSDWSWESGSVSLGARHSTFFPERVRNDILCVSSSLLIILPKKCLLTLNSISDLTVEVRFECSKTLFLPSRVWFPENVEILLFLLCIYSRYG